MKQFDDFESNGISIKKQRLWEITVTLKNSGEIRTFHVKSLQSALDMKETILSQNDEYFGDNVERCEISKEKVEVDIMKFSDGSILELIE